MRETLAFVLLSLHCLSLTSCAIACDRHGPESCRFFNSFCSWSQEDEFTIFNEGSGHYYCARFNNDVEDGKLESKKACSTQGETHCLTFVYNFEQNNIIDLSVIIKYEGTDDAKSLMWSVSSSNDWEYATVPVNTHRSFNIVFKAKRWPEHISSESSVLIDDISYRKSYCDLYPSNAAPATTTTLLRTTTTTKTTAAKAVTTGTSSKNSMSTPLSTPAVSARTTMSTLTISGNIHDKPEKITSRKVGLIVGVIVAVLVVIVVVTAMLLVVFRRMHIQFWKTCCKQKQLKEQLHMNACHNAAFGLDTDDPGHVHGAATHHTQRNSDNHRPEAGTDRHSSSSHYYESLKANILPEHVYAAVNKPRKVSQDTSSENQSKPKTTVYEMCNAEAVNCSNAERTEYQDISPTMAKQNQDGHNNSSSPLPTLPCGYNLTQPQNSNSVYHILEKESGTDSNSVQHVQNASVTATAHDHDGEYNRLDFDTKSRGETNSFDEEKTEIATGGVYSHLNEGDGDTYNEVHREKRDEVIDGVYSHIK